MNIQDFDIKIKKYDKKKNLVIVNVLVQGEIEIRGFTVRYTTTKYSPSIPIWLASPPCIKGRLRTYFWIVEFKDPALWQLLEQKIITSAKEYTDIL